MNETTILARDAALLSFSVHQGTVAVTIPCGLRNLWPCMIQKSRLLGPDGERVGAVRFERGEFVLVTDDQAWVRRVDRFGCLGEQCVLEHPAYRGDGWARRLNGLGVTVRDGKAPVGSATIATSSSPIASLPVPSSQFTTPITSSQIASSQVEPSITTSHVALPNSSPSVGNSVPSSRSVGLAVATLLMVAVATVVLIASGQLGGRAALPGSIAHTRYWVANDGNRYGPYDIEALRGLIQTGTVTPSTTLVADESTVWRAAGDIVEVALLFSYWVNVGGRVLGPYTMAQLVQHQRDGLINAGSKVRLDGGTEWTRLEAVDSRFARR